MKHIKKKFLFHDELLKKGDDIFKYKNKIIEIPSEIDYNKTLKEAKNNLGIITKENGDKIFSMVYNDNGKYCMIPVPDFSLVNYHNAYKLNHERKVLKKELMNHLEI